MSGTMLSEDERRIMDRRISAVRVTVSRGTLCLPLHEDPDVAGFRRSFEDTRIEARYIREGRHEVQALRTVTMVPLTPVQLNFRTQQLAEGLRALVGVIFGFSVGLFLITHIPSTPLLQMQVMSVAVICLLLGASLLPFTVGCLLGRLRIDSSGITVTPRLVGFQIRWQELKCWSLEGVQLHLLSRRSDREEIVALHALPPGDRLLVRDIMRSCVSEKEGKPSLHIAGTAPAARTPANLPG